jgi:hypothetical protein
VSGREPENKWGRGIDPQNSNIESTGSISLGGVKRLAESMVVTYGVGYIPSLERLVVENPKTSGAGGLTPKIGILSAPARSHRWGVKRLV